jgi:hypothetical protein
MATISFDFGNADTTGNGSVNAPAGGAGPYVLDDGVSGSSTLTVGGSATVETGNGSVYNVTYNGLTANSHPVFEVVSLDSGPGIGVSNGDLALLSDTSLSGESTAVTDTTTQFPVCFASGTLVATPTGERAVETLEIGDMVLTSEGRAVPVRWIGRQTLMPFFAGAAAAPVRVTAGALGDGLPKRDLVLTADHALVIDGLAVIAGALVNGSTICYDPIESLPKRVTYYHVETDDHDVILAEGAPAETFIDYAGRQAFDNYAEYVELYGVDRVITEMPLPRISTARLLPPALKARLSEVVAA